MICKAVQGLIDHSVSSGLITEEDYFVVRNMIMDMLKLSDWEDCGSMEGTPEEILNIITDYACENRIIENTAVQRDLFDTKIMGAVTPMPREVKEKFFSLYNSSPEKATDWYYQFCKDLNYVRADRIAKDLKWTYESEYGTLDITINRSKPEKDPRDIAAAKSQKKTLYPKCQLCAENMGFAGHMNHAARQNLRPVPLNIAGENWYLQYSPYGYYNEHCIVFNSEHTPMVIDASVFDKLFDFIEQFVWKDSMLSTIDNIFDMLKELTSAGNYSEKGTVEWYDAARELLQGHRTWVKGEELFEQLTVSKEERECITFL